ncbi:MAG: CinA family nicotinamide mononucleotide deamidase-related protein [Bacteriovoracaceae bacterium]
MQIELIIIASEILNGKIQDLNTHWLSRFLFKQGFGLCHVTIIPDDESTMVETFQKALERSQIIITSGGLGPTKDDLTKDMVGKLLGKELIESAEALKITEKNYERFKRTYEKEKFHYHTIPEGTIPFNNPCGTAPGLATLFGDKCITCLPGVPKEFEEMFAEEIFPFLQKQYNLKPGFQSLVTVKTKLLPESKIFSEICPTLWDDLSLLGSVSSLPHIMGVDIGVMISAKSELELDQKKSKALTLMQNPSLQNSIWNVGHESLEEIIIKEAAAKGLTIGTVESCTGGLIANRLTNVSGSSSVFLGSIISYANSVKEELAHVPKATLKEFGAVSIETAKCLADGGVKSLGAHIVVATTGIAGPTGGSKEKPVGTICIGLKSNDKAHAESYHFAGDRLKLKERFSQMALYLLLDEIRGYR